MDAMKSREHDGYCKIFWISIFVIQALEFKVNYMPMFVLDLTSVKLIKLWTPMDRYTVGN